MQHTALTITPIVSMPFDENTFVVSLPGRHDCLVIDPGLEPEKVLAHLDQAKLVPAAILVTHGHSDHIAGNQSLKQRWPSCPLVIGRGDAPKLTDSTLNLSAPFGLEVISPQADVLLGEEDRYEAAGLALEVLAIPGHSSGHVVYVWKGGDPWVVFGGDVLFRGSVGRTDFPGGSFQQLANAIHRKLFTLPDDTRVLPGHGPATTVGHEKQTNPYVGVPSGYRPS